MCLLYLQITKHWLVLSWYTSRASLGVYLLDGTYFVKVFANDDSQVQAWIV